MQAAVQAGGLRVVGPRLPYLARRVARLRGIPMSIRAIAQRVNLRSRPAYLSHLMQCGVFSAVKSDMYGVTARSATARAGIERVSV